MKIAVIGSGFTGLTAALRLLQEGHDVTIFEKNDKPGGLATGFRQKNWQWNLELFYHHLFPSDTSILNLTKELGLEEKLFFKNPKTSIFYKSTLHQFDSPLSLLAFPHLNWPEKVRTGLVTLYLKLTSNWQKLEKSTAYDWLQKFYGERAFKILWQPLISAKFGPFAKDISMAWFWARIKKRDPRLGYFEGGFATLVKRLVEEIENKGGKLLLNHSVENLDRLKDYDKILVTLPTSIFLKMSPSLPENYAKQLQELHMLGAIVLILVLKEKFLEDGTYWLNINEEGFPFIAVVEHTNFVDPQNYGNEKLLYVGGYYPQEHPYFKMSDQELLNEFLPSLRKVNPNYQWSDEAYFVFKAGFAQPVVPINYSRIVPQFKTPIPNVYLANMQQIYPWDRGTNYAVEEGEKVAQIILNDIKNKK